LGVFSPWDCQPDGGLLVGILANGHAQYIGTDKEAPGVSMRACFTALGNQLLLQLYGAAFIIVYNAIATFIILKVISSSCRCAW
jgi:Amt family ammonium transporter